MKFRRNKIKREHSIIKGALDWLEDLSKLREVTDIIPGVIDVTHSKERGIAYQYETPTGCKLLLKNGGSIQEAFVVTAKPEAVQAWVAKVREELELMQTALDDQVSFLRERDREEAGEEARKTGKTGKAEKAGKEGKAGKESGIIRSSPKIKQDKPSQKGILQIADESCEPFFQRDKLLAGVKEAYQLVEINPGLRDSFVESLASMADLENPKIQDSLEPALKDALEDFQQKLSSSAKSLKQEAASNNNIKKTNNLKKNSKQASKPASE